jgi:hypothetical protein
MAARFVDDRTADAAAPPEAVWAALGRYFQGWGAPAAAYARAVGAEPWRRSGDPLVAGSTLPGFRVEEAVPGQLLRLVGRHRFSTYALTFTLADDADRTTLTAHTDARFPGLLGEAYRALVIRSGAHRTLTRRMLRSIARSAERR